MSLELLLQRNSAPKLCEPGPDADSMESIFKAALRAPDHARLRPWKFFLYEGEARHKLGEMFASTLLESNPDATPEQIERARALPLRAPAVVAVAAVTREHPKVPHLEQVLSAGCAAHAMLLAAEALGFAGIWRTGEYAFDANIRAALGLAEDDQIVAFLYLGSRDGLPKPLPDMELEDFLERM